MDWLFEGLFVVYLLLAAAAGGLLWLWWADRKERWLLALIPVVLLALAYFLLDRAVETRGEQIKRRLGEIEAAINRKDARAILRHLSPTRFRQLAGGQDDFIRRADAVLNEGWFDTVDLWEFRVGPPGTPTLLNAKAKGGVARGEFLLIRTEWVEERPGEWLLAGFSAHHPFVDTGTAVQIPHFGQ